MHTAGSAAALAGLCLVAPCSATAAATADAAATSATNIAASYRAPAECPTPAAWRAALQSRAGAELAPLSGRLAVEIQRRQGDAGTTYEGHIRQGGAGTARAGRHVRGATCEAVFEALALIARLGLSAMAVPATAPEREPSSAPTPAQPSWTLTAQEELALARDLPPAPDLPAPKAERLRLAAAALALWGGASHASADPDLGLALTARGTHGPLQPFLLVGAYAGRERFGVSGTTAGARLERLALHAVACPLRFPREAAYGLRPCVDLDVGMLRGSGVSVDAARGHTAPWASTGVQLRAEWSPWGPLELGAMIGGVLALSRPRFYFEPDTTAFRADAASLRAGASAGVSF